MLTDGSIFFKELQSKVRPFVCIHTYRNSAGIPYNWLVLPITTSTKLGMSNLVEIEHEKLKRSYVKINNITTIQKDDLDRIRVSNYKLDEYNIRLIICKIIKTFKNESK